MAVNEVIRSAFPAQPATRSPKLPMFEALFLLNQGIDQVAATLRTMMKFPFAHKDALQCAHDEIEELRAGVNADFVEELGNRERDDEGRFWKRRRAYEQKLEDPDDVYINLEHRENERKKLGLPARIGLIPHSAISEEEQRWQARQDRKKKRSRKLRK